MVVEYVRWASCMRTEGDVRGMRVGCAQRTAERSDIVGFEAIGQNLNDLRLLIVDCWQQACCLFRGSKCSSSWSRATFFWTQPFAAP